EDSGRVNVLYDGDRLVSYDFTNLEELEPAFAITVHKSQGSEFPVVVMPMTHFPPMLATRNLLYTAITRAKEGVVMVGDPRMPGVMTDNTSARKRNSGLKARLVKLWETDYEHHRQ
ncbi:MAG: ATP-binding domain-containing protein, partial [Firmicutes bacterium]|nr:ATP-binding domain-containing protein [Bacillota bacterium]